MKYYKSDKMFFEWIIFQEEAPFEFRIRIFDDDGLGIEAEDIGELISKAGLKATIEEERQ